jgi:hypothetical protein
LPKGGRGNIQDYNTEIAQISGDLVNVYSTLSLSEQQLSMYVQESFCLNYDSISYSLLELYSIYCQKEKRTFEALNTMRLNNNLFTTYFWGCESNIADKLNSNQLNLDV